MARSYLPAGPMGLAHHHTMRLTPPLPPTDPQVMASQKQLEAKYKTGQATAVSRAALPLSRCAPLPRVPPTTLCLF